MSPSVAPITSLSFLREVFDAIPAMLLVVDEDVRIHHLNTLAAEGLKLDLLEVRNRRTGEVLHCVHAAAAKEGCGRGEFCQDCVIRNAVHLALGGCRTHRKGVSMTLGEGAERRDIQLLISTSPFSWAGKMYAILVVETASDLFQLRSLLPICMHCKRIRDESGLWHDMTSYFQCYLDLNFSHGLCPECLESHYSRKDPQI